ncbi:MAG: right-handed parallel beta-helix repeat-containing protein, partial [Rhizomicrobium sp.]
TSETLYFWPPDNSSDPMVYAPRLRTILQIGKGVSYVTFRGFTFEDFEGTAITLNETTHCLIAGNVIRNGGDYQGSGVSVNGGTDNGVAGNDIYQIGSSAIVLSGGDRATLTPAGNYANNNYIHHTGVYYKQGVGISLTGCGLRASHNLIHDTPRIAIMFSGNNLVIEYNHMHHVNLETEDTGVVYTGGRDWISSRGTVIRYNYMHDSIGFGQENGKWISPHFSWGVYLDDNTGGVDVIGNIVVRAYRGLIHLHNGRDNLIENNIFVDGKLQQAEFNGWTVDSHYWKDHFPSMMKGYAMVKDQPAWKNMRNIGTSPDQAVLPGGLIMSGNVFRRNIVYSLDPSAKLFSSRNLPLDHNEWDENVYWHAGLPWKIALGGKLGELDLDGWRAKGLDQHSVVADPLFVNAAKDDYRLKGDSPALKLGFKPIPIEKIGPYKDELRASWPIKGE